MCIPGLWSPEAVLVKGAKIATAFVSAWHLKSVKRSDV